MGACGSERVAEARSGAPVDRDGARAAAEVDQGRRERGQVQRPRPEEAVGVGLCYALADREEPVRRGIGRLADDRPEASQQPPVVQQAYDPPTSGDLHAVRRRAKLDQVGADPAARTVWSGGQSHVDPQPPLVVGSRAEDEQTDRPTIPLGLRCDPHQDAPAPRLRAGGSRDDDPCDPRLRRRWSARSLLGRGRRTRAYDRERRNRRGATP